MFHINKRASLDGIHYNLVLDKFVLSCKHHIEAMKFLQYLYGCNGFEQFFRSSSRLDMPDLLST